MNNLITLILATVLASYSATGEARGKTLAMDVVNTKARAVGSCDRQGLRLIKRAELRQNESVDHWYQEDKRTDRRFRFAACLHKGKTK